MESSRETAPGRQLAMTTRPDDDGNTVIGIRGDLDLATVLQLHAAVYTAIRRFGPRLVIDLAEVPFCDATGLGMLVRAGELARDAGGRLVLAHPPPMLVRLLRLTGLDRQFQDPRLPNAAAS